MKLASPNEGDLELLRFVGKYLKGCPDIHLLHKRTYPGCSFQEKRNRNTGNSQERNVYKQRSLIEICSDSDWAADRTSRQSVSCGAILLNGNLIHFQSKAPAFCRTFELQKRDYSSCKHHERRSVSAKVG